MYNIRCIRSAKCDKPSETLHGIHTNSSYAGKTWDAVWDDFIKNNDSATIDEIEDFLDEQAEIFKITEYRAVKAGG